MKMSGVPLLERKADERWGGQEEYEAYKAATPVLIPRPPRVENEPDLCRLSLGYESVDFRFQTHA